MAKKTKRILLKLVCTVCKSENYTTEKNPQNATIKGKGKEEKLSLKKFCQRCRKATQHKETKI